MVDRIALLKEVSSRTKLNIKDSDDVAKKLNALLQKVLPKVSLDDARALDVRDDLDVFIRTEAPSSVLGALSNAWEPARKTLTRDHKEALNWDLSDLLMERRGRYEAPDVSLEEAKLLTGKKLSDLEATIRLAPVKDLKALLKKWDPKRPPLTAGQLHEELRLLREGKAFPHPDKKLTLSDVRGWSSDALDFLSTALNRETVAILEARLKKWDELGSARLANKAAKIDHLVALAKGEVEPVAPPPPPPRAPRKKRTKTRT